MGKQNNHLCPLFEHKGHLRPKEISHQQPVESLRGICPRHPGSWFVRTDKIFGTEKASETKNTALPRAWHCQGGALIHLAWDGHIFRLSAPAYGQYYWRGCFALLHLLLTQTAAPAAVFIPSACMEQIMIFSPVVAHLIATRGCYCK